MRLWRRQRQIMRLVWMNSLVMSTLPLWNQSSEASHRGTTWYIRDLDLLWTCISMRFLMNSLCYIMEYLEQNNNKGFTILIKYKSYRFLTLQNIYLIYSKNLDMETGKVREYCNHRHQWSTIPDQTNLSIRI
jgi:hypothetical protein